MPYLKTKQEILWHYELDGRGEPIVFLHGWGGDLRLWSAQSEYFSHRYKVIRIDLPGHGKSGWKKMSLPAMAQDLEKILDRLLSFVQPKSIDSWKTKRNTAPAFLKNLVEAGTVPASSINFTRKAGADHNMILVKEKSVKCKQINMIGSSLGGLIALQWFDLFPERFNRLILVGALPKFLMTQDYPYGLELPRLQKLDEQLNTDYPAIVNIFFRSLFTRQERESSRFKYFEQFKKNDVVPWKDALREFLHILEKEDLRKTLEKINRRLIPVQILNGTDDYICSKEAVGYLQRELPRARVELFQDCGHFPFLTKPKEFNEALENFLANSISPPLVGGNAC